MWYPVSIGTNQGTWLVGNIVLLAHYFYFFFFLKNGLHTFFFLLCQQGVINNFITVSKNC